MSPNTRTQTVTSRCLTRLQAFTVIGTTRSNPETARRAYHHPGRLSGEWNGALESRGHCRWRNRGRRSFTAFRRPNFGFVLLFAPRLGAAGRRHSSGYAHFRKHPAHQHNIGSEDEDGQKPLRHFEILLAPLLDQHLVQLSGYLRKPFRVAQYVLDPVGPVLLHHQVYRR